MNEARLGPLYMIIQVDTSTFSDPRSPRTLEGHPNAVTASRKSASTVWAVLRVDTLIPVICEGYGQRTSMWTGHCTYHPIEPIRYPVDYDTPQSKLMVAIQVP